MIEFSDNHKITKVKRNGQTEFSEGLNQKKLFADTYISKKLSLLKYCNDSSRKINSFIKELNVDCLSGKTITMEGAVEPYCLTINGECIGYVTSNDGESFLIPDLVKEFLIFCEPEAVVSKEGIVIFYYDMNIVATITGKNWYFLSFDVEWAETYVQKGIECIENISSDYNMTTIQFKMDDETKENFELCFELDFFGEDDMIQCYLSKENV